MPGRRLRVYVYNEGKEDHTQVFAQLTQRDGSFLVGRETDDDFTWDKLKGKYVLPGRKGGVPYMTLEYVLRQNGLDPGVDVTVDNSVQFAIMAGAFTGGTGDYVTLFEPTASAMETGGQGLYRAPPSGQESRRDPLHRLLRQQELSSSKTADLIAALHPGRSTRASSGWPTHTAARRLPRPSPRPLPTPMWNC